MFYGTPGEGATAIALESGYDYEITAIVITAFGAAGLQYITLEDESSRQILSIPMDSADGAGFRCFTWAGSMAIGPRTALTLGVETGDVTVIISGNALTPETILSV